MNDPIHIILPSSDYYIPYTAVMMTSVVKNKSKDDNLFFHVISENISEYNITVLNSIKEYGDFCLEIKIVDQKLISTIVTCAQQRIGNICNYKLFIASLFNFDRAIVLEGDMIVLGSLKNLYDMDMKDHPMAAVKDPLCNEIQHLFDIPNSYRYCNTGMFLANLKYWREHDCQNKFLETAQKYNGKLLLPDQDIFNHVFYKSMMYLPFQYNVFASVTRHNFPVEQKEADQNPIIIHWADYRKPWEYLDIKYSFLFWKYAKLSPLYEMITYRLFQNLYYIMKPKEDPIILKLKHKYLSKKVFLYKVKYFFTRKSKYIDKIEILKNQF